MPAEVDSKHAPRESGLLNIDKPSGVSSRYVVNQVERLARPAKAGHAGTLDPLATGVLVVCVGAATRLIEYVQRLPKRYRGTFLLGQQSPTEDIEGEIEHLANAPQPSRARLQAALEPFRGEILQRPPAFSALKVSGQRAYDLARRGQQVILEPRPITIHDLRLISYDYPEFCLEIACGSGTYVRSLGRDIAASLGTAAVMSALERTAIGDFTLAEAVRVEELTPESWRAAILPAGRAVAALPRLPLTETQLQLLSHGLALDPARCAQLPPEAGHEVAAFAPDGTLAAVLTRRGDQWKLVRNLVGRG